jgi:hypothetical protein
MAKAEETTVAAPPISPRINFMFYNKLEKGFRSIKNALFTAPGFRLMPPESKVMPLPTNASGCSFLLVAPL